MEQAIAVTEEIFSTPNLDEEEEEERAEDVEVRSEREIYKLRLQIRLPLCIVLLDLVF